MIERSDEGPPGVEVELDDAGQRIVYRELDGVHTRGELRAGGLADSLLLSGHKIALDHTAKRAKVFAVEDQNPAESMAIRVRQRAAAAAKKGGKKKIENAANLTTPRTCPKFLIGGGRLETRGIIDRPDFQTVPSAIERRFSPTGLIAQRAGTKDGSGVYGYPVLWKTLSQDLGGFREQIMPGTFDDSLAADDMDVVLLFNHDSNLILGRESNGTLHLRGDTTGLHMEATLPQTTLGKDVSLLLERGDLRGMSFAFMLNDGGDYWSENGGEVVRTVTSARLFDVSVVTNAAYPDAWAAIAKQRMQAWRENPGAQRDMQAATLKLLWRTDPIKAAAMMQQRRDELVRWANSQE